MKHGLHDCVILESASNRVTTARESDCGRIAYFGNLKLEGSAILPSTPTGGLIRNIGMTQDPADDYSKNIVDKSIRDRDPGLERKTKKTPCFVGESMRE